MTRARAIGTALLIIWGELTPRPVQAQSLGTFRWQLQPYCNVVTVSVTQNGGVYTVDGYDDQCGGTSRAPVVGLATPNPDDSIGMGFHVVTTPSATPVSVQATISLATLGGTWRDSAGNTGTFAFGAATGGNPRPPAVATFPAGIAAGGARVTNVGTPTQPTDAATKGYVDAVVPTPSQFTFQADGGFVARGDAGVGAIPANGDGVRMMWYPGKAAFRAGWSAGTAWDDANVGIRSFAVGAGTRASGQGSTVFGEANTASGPFSVAMGTGTTASGSASVAAGGATQATGDSSTALGSYTVASGFGSLASGFQTTAAGTDSTAMGWRTVANGALSTVLGTWAGTTINATGSFVYGDSSDQSAINLVSIVPNEFLVRAAGGTTFYSNAARTTGVRLAAGGGAWINLSDASRKQTFRDLDGESVLGKIRAMPIREWSYISQGDGIRHVGPTAQDFRAAFGLGEDPLGISTIDADGISLRAVQALEARTEAQQTTIDELKTQNTLLRQRLEALELRLSTTPPAPR